MATTETSLVAMGLNSSEVIRNCDIQGYILKGEPKRCSDRSEFGYEKIVKSRTVPRFLAQAVEEMQPAQNEIGQGCQ